MAVADINDGGWVLVAEYTALDNAKDAFNELVRYTQRREPRYLARLGYIALITNVTLTSNKHRSYSIYIQIGGGV